MIRAVVRAAVPALALIAAAGQAAAEPAFAVRTGYRCSQCHLNRTGGGLRTPFGSLYTQTVLPRRLLKWREEGNLIPADPSARWAVGADVRLQYLDLRSRGRPDTASFEIPEANLYLEGRLLPERLSLYADTKIGPGGASSREVFALYSFGKWRGYVKAGKFLPPYGWRLPDDAAFIRRFSGFTYSAPDTGIELGIEPGRWSLHLAAVNGASGGSEDNRSKQLSLLAVRRIGAGRLGLSASNNITSGTRITQAGLLGGVRVGRLSVLAEGDWRETSDGSGTRRRLIGLFELNVLASRGINLKIAHDWTDPDLDRATDARVRDSVGLEYIPVPFLQLRLFARRSNGPVPVQGARDRQVDLEVHVFF